MMDKNPLRIKKRSQSWTDTEITKLIELNKKGYNFRKIAEILKRSRNAVYEKYISTKLKNKKD